MLNDGGPGLATVVTEQPPKRATEVHLVGMRVEVGVAGPLLVPEHLELGADELGSSDAVPAGLEVTKRPLFALARDGDAVLADAPNLSRPRAEGAGQMSTKHGSSGEARFDREPARLGRGEPLLGCFERGFGRRQVVTPLESGDLVAPARPDGGLDALAEHKLQPPEELSVLRTRETLAQHLMCRAVRPVSTEHLDELLDRGDPDRANMLVGSTLSVTTRARFSARPRLMAT